jgi:hypothetical protein
MAQRYGESLLRMIGDRKTTILTLIADRIMIMGKGRLSCAAISMLSQRSSLKRIFM